MTTEAGKADLLHNLDISGAAAHPHPNWITSCWACDDIAAIEAEARIEGRASGVDYERGRITRVASASREPEADEAFDFVNGREAWKAGWFAGRDAVLAIVNREIVPPSAIEDVLDAVQSLVDDGLWSTEDAALLDRWLKRWMRRGIDPGRDDGGLRPGGSTN